MTDLFKSLQTFRAHLNDAHLEREEVIDGLLATLISKQNAFLLGEPGTGKSDLVRSICNGIEGANYFGYLLTPTSDPSELFGPVAVTKLLNDEYQRDVEGYLPSAHIAFTDELFRGSSAILNSLLTLLNERTFNNGKETIQTPIQSIVAATNSWPEEESLQAFADRFLFRPTVPFLSKSASKRTLDMWAAGLQPRPEVGVHLTLDQLFELQDKAQSLNVTDDFLDKFGELWSMLETRGLKISDRRRVQIIKFLKAWALVQGDDELYGEHMHNSLVHIVYRNEDDQATIRECLMQVCPTAEKYFADAKRAASGIMTEFQANAVKLSGRSLSDLNDYVKQCRRYRQDILKIQQKVTEALDGDRYKMSVSVRQKGVQLNRQLEKFSESIAHTIAEISN